MKPTTFEVHRFSEGDRGRIGYARVSTKEQNLASQLDALRDAGCHLVISEKVSSASIRSGWQRATDLVRPGDVVIVTRLDRVGRRLAEIISSVQALTDAGVHVRALQQGIDTSAPSGAILLSLFAALAETERTILRERTREGLAAAKARGKKVGRPVRLDDAKRELVAHLRGKGYSMGQIAKTVKVGVATVHRALLELAKEDPRQLALLEVGTSKGAAAAAGAELDSKAPAPRAKSKKRKRS